MADTSIEQIKKRKGINEKTENEKVEHKKTEYEKIELTVKNEELKTQPTVNTEVNTEEAKSPISAKPCVKRSRYIAREVKRAVFKRAEGKCEHINPNGERCQSRHQLEFDHARPFSQGGGNDVDNIVCRCRNHNLYRTKETHGFWY